MISFSARMCGCMVFNADEKSANKSLAVVLASSSTKNIYLKYHPQASSRFMWMVFKINIFCVIDTPECNGSIIKPIIYLVI